MALRLYLSSQFDKITSESDNQTVFIVSCGFSFFDDFKSELKTKYPCVTAIGILDLFGHEWEALQK